MSANKKRIADFALKSRYPRDTRESVDAGGLMYYGADLADSYRRVAISWTKFSREPARRPAGRAADEV